MLMEVISILLLYIFNLCIIWFPLLLFIIIAWNLSAILLLFLNQSTADSDSFPSVRRRSSRFLKVAVMVLTSAKLCKLDFVSHKNNSFRNILNRIVIVWTPLPFIKGRDEAFPKWLYWEDGKCLLEMGGKARNGGGGAFIVGGRKFLKSPYIVGREVLTPTILWRPPYIAYLSFSNFVQSPSTSLSNCSFCCPVSVAEWMIVLHLMWYFT